MFAPTVVADFTVGIGFDHLPVLPEELSIWVLNERGRAYIDRWVVANATQPERHSLPAWHRYAEIMAMQSDKPSDWVIEMAMSQTKSGYPEELRCPSQWFERQ